MSQDLNAFTPAQLSQLVEYLRFEEHKRREMKTEISGELGDLFDARIEKDMIYSGKDGIEILEQLPDELNKTISSELERSRDINVVLINHIFQEAQAANLTLQINVPDLINESLTDEANRLCDQLITKAEELVVSSKAAPAAAAPAPAGPTLEELQRENERLKAQLAQAKREWPEMKAAVQRLKDLNAQMHQIREQLGE